MGARPIEKAAKKRWPRRVKIGAGALVALIVLLVGGVFVYAHWRFGQIKKTSVNGLTARPSNGPFNVLLVGSDSRAFVDTAGEASAFGSSTAQTGQRSDVIIIARVDPSRHSMKLLSIPRDTYVDIPGSVSGISGPNRINAAFNEGPSLLVKTIQDSFHIPISDYAEVNFPGFSGMVDALGGIGLDFPDPVKDAYSQLHVTTTGCQIVHGSQALALVRSRHLYYESGGIWYQDGDSDWSRIQRQDAFFRALIPKMKGVITNPIALNNFLGAATKNITVDQTLSAQNLIGLAQDFRGISSTGLLTETLPTIPYTTSAGASVLLPAPAPDESTIAAFLAFGTQQTTAMRSGPTTAEFVLTSTTGVSAPTVTTIPTSNPPSSADVVYNTAKEPWNPTPCNP